MTDRPPLDPDPRDVLATLEELGPIHVSRDSEWYVRTWNAGFNEAWSQRGWRRPGLLGLVIAALAGAVIAALVTASVVHAAPRSASDRVVPAAVQEPIGAPQRVIPADPTQPHGEQVPSGNLAAGAPLSKGRSGVIAYATPALGSGYLAIPIGPGHRVRICSSSDRCLIRLSTDAGPAPSMLRAGRIADVAFVDFAWLCRCDPAEVGTIRGSWTLAVGPTVTPPATDVDG